MRKRNIHQEMKDFKRKTLKAERKIYWAGRWYKGDSGA